MSAAGVNPAERCQTETRRVGWSTETSLCSPAIRPLICDEPPCVLPSTALVYHHVKTLTWWDGGVVATSKATMSISDRGGVHDSACLAKVSEGWRNCSCETGRSCQLADHAGRFRCGRSWAPRDFSDAALDD